MAESALLVLSCPPASRHACDPSASGALILKTANACPLLHLCLMYMHPCRLASLCMLPSQETNATHIPTCGQCVTGSQAQTGPRAGCGKHWLHPNSNQPTGFLTLMKAGPAGGVRQCGAHTPQAAREPALPCTCPRHARRRRPRRPRRRGGTAARRRVSRARAGRVSPLSRRARSPCPPPPPPRAPPSWRAPRRRPRRRARPRPRRPRGRPGRP